MASCRGRDPVGSSCPCVSLPEAIAAVTDEALRALERRWRATGAIDDEALWLRERLRVGALERERAWLAAAFGHPAALGALGLRARPGGWVSWAWLRLRTLRLDDALAVRVMTALAFAARAHQLETPGCGGAVEALVRWCACPCPRHAGEVRMNAASLTAPYTCVDVALARFACDLVLERGPGREVSWSLALRALRREARSSDVARSAARWLIPWTLGVGDPFVDHVLSVAASIEELRTRFERTGAVADEAAWLAERLRRGWIDEARVRLAAHVGDPASAVVLGVPEGSAEEPSAWAGAIRTWGVEACVRFALAALRSVSTERTLDAAGQAVDAWLACPCEPHRARVGELARATEEPVLRAALSWALVSCSERIVRADAAAARARDLMREAARLSGDAEDQARSALAESRARELIDADPGWLEASAADAAVASIRAALAHPGAWTRIREGVRAELVAWALQG